MAASTSSGEREDRLRQQCEKSNHIIKYLMSGKYEEGSSESHKRVVRGQAKKHSYDEIRGELYYITGGNSKHSKRRQKVVLQEDEVLDLLKYYHSSETGGHSGINATLSKISLHYTWNGMKQDITQFIKSCDRCQRSNKIKTQAAELKAIKTKEPLELVGMEFVGPLPTTQEGFKYALAFTDHFTKFVEFFPLKTKEASGISACIQTFVWRWGAPKRLLIDEGQECVAKVNADLCKKLGIARSVTIAYHPQTNGLDEGTSQTLRIRLNKLVNDHQNDWNKYLDEVAYSIRTQKQASTEITPFFLMFGRHPRTVLEMEPADDDLTLPISKDIDNEDTDEAVSKREEEMVATTSQVKQNVPAAQKKQKIAFQRRKLKGVQSFELAIGDIVLRRDYKNVGRKGGKMEPQWLGSYSLLSSS